MQVGRCSRCNNFTHVPFIYMGNKQPPPRCLCCGKTQEEETLTVNINSPEEITDELVGDIMSHLLRVKTKTKTEKGD